MLSIIRYGQPLTELREVSRFYLHVHHLMQLLQEHDQLFVDEQRDHQVVSHEIFTTQRSR